MRKNILLTLGFLLFVIGMVSLFLGLSGVVFSFLKSIEVLGPIYAFGIKILMTVVGAVLAYLGYLDGTELDND